MSSEAEGDEEEASNAGDGSIDDGEEEDDTGSLNCLMARAKPMTPTKSSP